MSRKHAFVVYSGPEEVGRVFHALTHAKQVHQRGDNAVLYFAAEGTHWPATLAQSEHPMNALFSDMVRAGVVVGACEACANAFGTAEGAKEVVNLVRGPDASFGQIDIIGMHEDGYQVWLF